MSKLFFIKPVLEIISRGKFFRHGFALILRIIAILMAIGGLFLFIQNFRFIGRFGFLGALGLIIAQLFLLAAIWIIIQIIWNRANVIVNLPDSNFTIIPIFSIVLKMIGEVYATIILLLSISGAFLTWFIGSGGRIFYQLREFVPFLSVGTGFLGGLLLIVLGIISSFIALFFFYLFSEGIAVIFDIANNVKLIVDSKE